MGNRQTSMEKGQAAVLRGDLGFDDLRRYAAPYVSRHRLTVGRPDPLPCFEGQFGIRDIGEGQTVHQSQIKPETEFETSFIAKTGLLITVILSGRLEFSLDGEAHDHVATNTPLALAWINSDPVEVTRRTRLNDHLIKVQVHTPLAMLDDNWVQATQTLSRQDSTIQTWSPSRAVIDAAQALIDGQSLSPTRSRMAQSRFAIEATDSLLEHLELQSAGGASSRIEAARAYVEQTVAQRPDLAQIAAQTGFSVSALQRAYRSSFGMTVIEHQRNILLDQAMDALRLGQISVGEASRRAGYKTPTNFAAAFTKRFGVSPSRVR